MPAAPTAGRISRSLLSYQFLRPLYTPSKHLGGTSISCLQSLAPFAPLAQNSRLWFTFVTCFKMQENKAFLPEGTSPETAYQGAQLNSMDMAPTTSKWNPMGWQKKWKITTVVATIIAIIVIIVAAVEGSKHHKSKNSYSDYHALNYTLEDRWQGTNFFDNFDDGLAD